MHNGLLLDRVGCAWIAITDRSRRRRFAETVVNVVRDGLTRNGVRVRGFRYERARGRRLPRSSACIVHERRAYTEEQRKCDEHPGFPKYTGEYAHPSLILIEVYLSTPMLDERLGRLS